MLQAPRHPKLYLWLLVVSAACIAPRTALGDTIVLDVTLGPAPGSARLTWAGDTPPFEIYAAPGPASVVGQGNLLATTGDMEWIDGTAAAPIIYYVVIKSTVQLCGDGVRDGGEQCDDGNTANLDGCDAACQFEQAQRAIWFKIQFATDTVCTQNALGRAFAGAAIRNSLQSEIDSRVATGTFSLVLPTLGATDLTGTNDPSFELGFLTAGPEPGGGYNGANDLDWWHVIDPATLTPAREPLFILPASITNSALVAGPGAAVLPQLFMAGGPLLRLALAQLSISVGPTTTPLTSASGDPPGHVASESLDPSLTSYATCGSPNATASGHLCGNMTARSLAQTPIVQGLVGCGTFNCTQCYTASNTMLDAIIGGCTISLVGTQVLASQPDASDPAAPIAGAGPPYRFSRSGTSIVGCQDRNNQTVDLNTCLDSAAYSSFFRLATNRVIPK